MKTVGRVQTEQATCESNLRENLKSPCQTPTQRAMLLYRTTEFFIVDGKKFLPLKTQSNSLDLTQNGSPGLYFSPVPLRASVHQCVCDGE